VFRLGYRAFRRHQGRPAGGLVLGALFAFTTAVIHSFGDFGLHIPAIAVLVTVLCAQLCALSRTGELGKTAAVPHAPDGSNEYALRLGGLAPVAGLVLALALGLALYREGPRAERAERFRLAALHLSATSGPAGRERQMAYLRTAVHTTPEHASLHVDLAEAYFDRFKERRQQLTASGRFADATQAVLAPTAPALASAPSWLVASAAREAAWKNDEQQLARTYLLPALGHSFQARDLCPLMARPQMRIAAHVARLERADPCSAYLGRAKRLRPSDPELWYFAGVQEIQDGRPDEAWQSWRRSLECSGRYLPEILDRGAKLLPPADLVNKVLPDRPDLLLAVASQLYPQPEALAQRRPFLEKALALLANRPDLMKAKDLQVKASIHRSLGQPEEALAAYREALAREPQQVGWRYEFAKLLYQQGRLQEARHELLIILGQQAGHAQARELFEAVTREMAEKK
jgi:tetratricopeptide (TPR) repeat protein